MKVFSKHGLVASFVALQAVLADTATGGVFDGGSITGSDAGLCLSGFLGEDFTSAGAGLGFHHYEEKSDFWTGNRSQYSLCAGQAFGSPEGSSFVNTYEQEDAVEIGRGVFLNGSYSPWGFTLLPGSYVTPGLIWVPSLYVSAGALAHIEYLSMRRMTSELDSAEPPTFEKSGHRTNIYLGPSFALGWQIRLLFVTLFGEARASPFYEAVNKDSGIGVQFLVGFGVFSFK